MKNFTAQKNIKLSKFLSEQYGASMPYSTFRKLLRNKDIKINGIRVKDDVVLSVNDNVTVYFDGDNAVYTPIFTKKGVFVFHKPPTICSEDFEKEVNKASLNLKLCHRLDRNTSGLIVLANDEKAYLEMLSAFKKRTVEKYYIAEVYGKLPSESGRLNSYLKKDGEKGLVKIYDNKVEGSVNIITEYKVLSEREKTTVVEVKLITGKTHQIRAHFAHIGNFIVGDGKYGDNKINKELNLKRQHLTAYKIKFNFNKEDYLYPLNNVEIKLDDISF